MMGALRAQAQVSGKRETLWGQLVVRCGMTRSGKASCDIVRGKVKKEKQITWQSVSNAVVPSLNGITRIFTLFCSNYMSIFVSCVSFLFCLDALNFRKSILNCLFVQMYYTNKWSLKEKCIFRWVQRNVLPSAASNCQTLHERQSARRSSNISWWGNDKQNIFWRQWINITPNQSYSTA